MSELVSVFACLVYVLLVEFDFEGVRRDVRNQLTCLLAHAGQSELV
jgi:hypothetical protein